MSTINPELVPAINQSLGVALPVNIAWDELRAKLAAHINGLINEDFDKLVGYLYRIDVNEKKLRTLLDRQEGENAAGLIADLIIERQLQKIKSREQHKASGGAIDENEKW